MKQRSILILEDKKTAWSDFLSEFFEDTSCKLTVTNEAQEAALCLDREKPCFLFVNTVWVTPSLQQKIRFLHDSARSVKLIQIGGKLALNCDKAYSKIPDLADFQKDIADLVDLPDTVDVLIVDDEKQMAVMIQDYLGGRKRPVFEIRYAENGKAGLEKLKENVPDVVILDIKMPIIDGREVYRRIRSSASPVPVIVFFDAISGDEITDIHQWGRPAIIEKGAAESALPRMMYLIKKLAFFG